jgi:hypothetical protein
MDLCKQRGSEATMWEKFRLRTARMAALTLALTVAGSGVALAQDWRYNDHDRVDYRYDQDSDRGPMGVARDFGFQDGTLVGRKDLYQRKPLNPYPRGKYAHEDRGYHHEYGERYAYEAEYARAYREGYERAYR